jgi:hypothetical protein
MRSVPVGEGPVLAQRVQQMSLVEDQRPVEQFAAAGPDPAFHCRVHAGHPDAAEHDRDAGIGEDGVEQGRVLAVPVTDQVLHSASGVLEVHHKVAGGLGHPRGARARGDAEDPDAAAGMLNDCQDVQPRTGQRDRLEEVRGRQGLGLRAQELRPGGRGPVAGGGEPDRPAPIRTWPSAVPRLHRAAEGARTGLTEGALRAP